MAVAPPQVSTLYLELRRMASACLSHESRGHTLQPTALVHEVYLRLFVNHAERARLHAAPDPTSPEERSTILAMAALVMRRVLVDHARRRSARKRSTSAWKRVDAEHNAGGAPAPASSLSSLVELDLALARLSQQDPRCEAILSMRYLRGMTYTEIAEHLGISVSTVEKDMRYTLAWLARQLSS